MVTFRRKGSYRSKKIALGHPCSGVQVLGDDLKGGLRLIGATSTHTVDLQWLLLDSLRASARRNTVAKHDNVLPGDLYEWPTAEVKDGRLPS